MFQDMGARAHQIEQAELHTGTAVEQVAELVERYPALSEVELARLINLYRNLSALEVALMISDEQLGLKLDTFFADHRSALKTPFRQYGVLVGIAVAGLIAVLWAVLVVL